MEQREIVVIGAGPAGSVAAALLKRKGHDVLILERQEFPRFSIGESLLAHCLEFIEEAGMMPAIQSAGFQVKNGAAFARGQQRTAFDFREKFSPGPGTTFQVQRANFDQILADAAVAQGVQARYLQEVTAATPHDKGITLRVADLPTGETQNIDCRFVLDASGYGRVLARLFDLEKPSTMSPRKAIFTHIEDRISDAGFDREKILISVHPEHHGIWYWLIPFSNGRSSIGVVGEASLLDAIPVDAAPAQASDVLLDALKFWVNSAPNLQGLLRNAVWDTPANTIDGYSAAVKRLHGPSYVLLGNAAEFLDPVFSSGVTIALKSSKLAADAVHRHLSGEPVDWEQAFSKPLMVGVETFRAYVQGWYDGVFQDVVFYENPQPEIKRMISSILAGYAWDLNNPFVAEPRRRLKMLGEICKASA